MVALSGIATLVAFAIIGLAFYEAEVKGRIIILGLTAVTFAVPILIPSVAISTISFVARILLGIGCYVYWKWKTARIG